MSFVAAKCTQCGASIEVDDTKEAGICRSCGTAFITEKAINNYNTYVTNNVTKNIYGTERVEIEELIANGKALIKLCDWEKAKKVFTKAVEENPNNYQGWLGLVQSETADYTDFGNSTHNQYLQKALVVADDNEKRIIINQYEQFSKFKKEWDDLHNKTSDSVERAGTFSILSFAIIAFALIGFVFGAAMIALGSILWGTIVLVAGAILCGLVVYVFIKKHKAKKEWEINLVKISALAKLNKRKANVIKLGK